MKTVRMVKESGTEYLAESDQLEEENVGQVEFRNPIRSLGFAQIEHIICLDSDLSDGAYRTLALLHFFWQRKKSAYPSLEKLASLRGKDTATISRHLKELSDKGIISRGRRVGTSSITYLEDLPQSYYDAAEDILAERTEDQHRKNAMSSPQKCGVRHCKNAMKRITRQEEQVKNNHQKTNFQLTNPDGFSKVLAELEKSFRTLKPLELEEFSDMWTEFPDEEAHAFALKQTIKYADSFSLNYYYRPLQDRMAQKNAKSQMIDREKTQEQAALDAGRRITAELSGEIVE